jgi:energy-converting hydrogenase Eha subunit A
MAPKILAKSLALWNIEVFGKKSSFVFAVQLGLAFWVFLVPTNSVMLLGSHIFLGLNALRAVFQYLELKKREQGSLMEYFGNTGTIGSVAFIVSWDAEMADPTLITSLRVAGIIFDIIFVIIFVMAARNPQPPFFENWPTVAMSTLSVIAMGISFLQRIFTSIISSFSGLEAAIITARQSRRTNASSGP